MRNNLNALVLSVLTFGRTRLPKTRSTEWPLLSTSVDDRNGRRVASLRDPAEEAASAMAIEADEAVTAKETEVCVTCTGFLSRNHSK